MSLQNCDLHLIQKLRFLVYPEWCGSTLSCLYSVWTGNNSKGALNLWSTETPFPLQPHRNMYRKGGLPKKVGLGPERSTDQLTNDLHVDSVLIRLTFYFFQLGRSWKQHLQKDSFSIHTCAQTYIPVDLSYRAPHAWKKKSKQNKHGAESRLKRF